jgi:hypothetical protein
MGNCINKNAIHDNIINTTETYSPPASRDHSIHPNYYLTAEYAYSYSTNIKSETSAMDYMSFSAN